MGKARKYWLIGASFGIGEALAHTLSSQHDLLLSARSFEKLSDLKQSIEGNSSCKVDIMAMDLLETEALPQYVAQAMAHGVDGVIVSAGAYTPMSVHKVDRAAMMTMVNVNLVGVMALLTTLASQLPKNKPGHIVILGSVAGYRGLPNAWAYGATKAACNHMAECLRLELLDTAIHVQLVCPGFVQTRLTDQNTFAMPGIIDASTAAKYIVRGMQTSRFIIGVPPLVHAVFVYLKWLPWTCYEWFIRLFVLKSTAKK